MKNTIVSILACLFFTACGDFLEEDTSSLIDVEGPSMKTEQGLEVALAGMYKPLSYTWKSGLGNTSTQAICMGSDDLTTHHAANKADFREFDQFNVTNLNYRLQVIWDGMYNAIQGANLIIDNYKEATGNEETIRQYAGEAYFLRAYCYFWVARLWEKAPLTLDSHKFSEAQLKIESSSQAELYQQIVSDCQSAIETMPFAKRVQPGRAGKASAKALLAEAYLHMAGYPLKQTENYAKAATVAKELIDNKEEYGLALMENFADLWQAENDGNSEEIFALTFSGGIEGNDNGNALYGSANRPGDIGGWDDIMCEIDFYNSYPEQPRKTATFTSSVIKEIDGVTTEVSWQDFNQHRPYFKKFEGEKNIWFLSQSLPLERFSEVYLIFAEAQVMATSNPNDAEALEALNIINRRANGVELYSPSTFDYTSASQEAILQEKAWEHAGEWVRWFDLVRTETVEEANAKKNTSDLAPIGTLDKADYFMPLPATETSINPNL